MNPPFTHSDYPLSSLETIPAIDTPASYGWAPPREPSA